MTTEVELERMVIRLIGDGSSYQKMLKDAQASTQSATRTIQQSGKQLEAFGKSVNSVGRSMQGFGAKLTAGVTAPLAAMNAGIIKAGADFDSGFAGVKKTIKATDEELAVMRTEFQKLSEEIPVTTTELLKIGETAGQLGVETENVVAFTRTVAMLASATNMTAEEGATSLAKFANVANMAQKDFDKLGAVIVALGNEGASTESTIAQMSTRMGSAARIAGMTVPEMMALTTTVADIGMEAEAGGSALSRIISRVNDAVQLNNKFLPDMAKLIGKTDDEFKKLWDDDPTAVLQQMAIGLDKMGKAATPALAKMGMKDVYVRQAFSGMASQKGIALLSQHLKTANDQWNNNTALVKEATERYKTFWSQVTLLTNQFNLLAVDLFDLMRPALEGVIEQGKQVILWLRSLSPEMKIMILNVLKIAAVVGPLVTILGTLIAVGGTLVSAVGAIAGAFAALSGPALAIVAIVAVLAGVLASVAAYLIGADGIAEAFNIIMARLQNFANFAIGFFQHFGQNFGILGKWLQDNWKTIIDDMGKIFGVFLGNAIQNLGVMLTTFVRLFTVWAGWLAGLFKKIFQTDFIGAIVNGIRTALEVFSQFFGKVVEGLQASFSGKKVDFGAFVNQLEKDFAAGMEDVNPLDAMQKVIEEQAAQLKNPLAGFEATTPLPQLVLGGMPEVPRNALADQSALGAIAAPFQAAAQPGSPQREAVQQFAEQAGSKLESLQEKIAENTAAMVEKLDEQLKNPGFLLSPSGGLGSP